MVLFEEVKGKVDGCTSNVILVLERDTNILFTEYSACPFTICNKKGRKKKENKKENTPKMFKILSFFSHKDKLKTIISLSTMPWMLNGIGCKSVMK